jgi:hypothetical protein
MDNGHEANKDAYRSPDEINGAESDLGSFFTVNGTWGRMHGIRIVKEAFELYFLAIYLRPSAPLFLGISGSGAIGHGISFYQRNEVISFLEEFYDDFAGGVIGIGDKIEGFGDLQRFYEGYHLVQEGSLVPV